MDQALNIKPLLKASAVAALTGMYLGLAAPIIPPAEAAARAMPSYLQGSAPLLRDVRPLPNRWSTTTHTDDLDAAILAVASRNGVDAALMQRIVACESGGDPNAVGDGGQSYGLVQIHLPAHPQITKAEASDPLFSLEFLAQNLKAGAGHLWSCYDL